MSFYSLNEGRVARCVFSVVLTVFCVLSLNSMADAQSTFGTVLGTVKDPSSSAVPKANVELLNVGTNSARTATTNDSGMYQFVNVEQGKYQLKITATGFETVEFTAFDMAARDTKRFDGDLKVATQATVVTVEAASVLQTETSSVAYTKGSLELTNLPVAIGSRSTGSTSAFSTLTAQPGVQIDSNNNISVAGATTSQLSFSIDGISSVGPGATAGPLTELFPSFNAIEEIRISENLNPAEYGGVADVTTVSKSGTNALHGGAFENLQNNDFNAADTFAHTTPIIKLNDYGLYLGGPVVLPKLYDGHNKTFFFGSFERLSLPKGLTQILSTPTEAMRNGDLSAYLNSNLGGDGVALTGYPGNIIPASQINPWAKAALNAFYPLPNYGAPGAITNNYLATYQIPILSAQFDARIDELISAKHFLFARYTYKNRRVTNAPGGNSSPASPLVGETSQPEVDNALTVGYNWIASPSLVNEARGGFTRSRSNTTFALQTQAVANELGLAGPPNGFPEALPTIQTIPNIFLTGFMSVPSPNADINPEQGTVQFSDTLTYTKGKHTIKIGGDFRHLTALFTNVFLNYRLGQYTFNGQTQTSSGVPWLGSGLAAPIAGMLLGYPDSTIVSTVLNPTTNSWANHYAFFAQDDFKVSPSFTLNYGLRYEYHPVFRDYNNNLANFDPNYNSVQNGVAVHGAVIVPVQASLGLVNPGFAQSIAPTPILTAAQAGVPVGLRDSQKTDFAPRIGFAWRIFDNKTVLRGGYGRFIEAPLSLSAIDGWSVEASDVGGFSNSIGSNGLPTLKEPYSFPSNIALPGTQWFDLATAIHYKDPVVQEWDLTIERDLGQGFGVRLAYDGNHGSNLPTDINLNQIPTNNVGYSTLASTAPFPQLYAISYQTNLGFTNFNSGTISVRKRSSSLQLEASYAFTKDLTNINGSGTNNSAQTTVNEFGNALLSDPTRPGLDYGNTGFARRQRFLATFLYELPFGKGRKYLNNANRFANALFGGWELSGILLFQSGPFLTVTTSSDPSGTGYNLCPCNYGNGGRADTVPGVNPYAGQSLSQWINLAAFKDPGNAIGRFGDATQGDVTGPGQKVLSSSLIKRFQITERARMEIGAQVANLTNHPNYQPPGNLNVSVAAFGAITAMQTAEAGGPRQIQLTGRIVF